MLEVILSKLPRLFTLEAVRPDHPSVDGVRASEAGLLSSRTRPASCMFTPFNPSCKARSSTVANFIRSVRVWPFPLGQCVSRGLQWQLGETGLKSHHSILFSPAPWSPLAIVKGQIKVRRGILRTCCCSSFFKMLDRRLVIWSLKAFSCQSDLTGLGSGHLKIICYRGLSPLARVGLGTKFGAQQFLSGPAPLFPNTQTYELHKAISGYL